MVEGILFTAALVILLGLVMREITIRFMENEDL